GGTFASGANYVLTNTSGDHFTLRVDARVGEIIGQPIPAFAWRITAPRGFYLGQTFPDRSAGFQLFPTRWADIVTNPPAPVTVAVNSSGNNKALTWTAEPFV